MSKSKHAIHRAKVRRQAIALMGGRCQRCGFDDERALQFDHVKPARRGLNGKRKSGETGIATHRAIVNGMREGYQLLCANCHAIKTREDDPDGSSSMNWSRSEALASRLREAHGNGEATMRSDQIDMALDL
jgi:5-methylcytosine-specific restriction endonuclease McrA